MLQNVLLFVILYMNSRNFLKLKLVIIWIFITQIVGFSQYHGFVFSEENTPLEGVTIFEENHETGTVTDKNGYFLLPFPHEHDMTLTFSYIGYKSLRKSIKYNLGLTDIDTIILLLDTSLLSNVLVEDSRFENNGSINVKNDFLQDNYKGNFANTLELLPGISAINVGVGISKPVIRGLSSNRIIVNTHGIRMEGQQWGSDHGLEIDAFDVGQLEIVKGPQSLMYGSDALGGLIRVLPGKIPNKNRVSGEIATVYKSNNHHLGMSAQLGYNTRKVFVNGRYTRHQLGDFSVPTESFDYNGFTLPIIDNNLRNTAGREQNISLEVGYIQKYSITRLRYSEYNFNGGIFSGAVGIPRSYTLRDDGNRRDIETPSQRVNHSMWILNHNYAQDDWEWSMDIGYQRNDRREFSRPEFHRIPISIIRDVSDLALGLDLHTYTAQSQVGYTSGVHSFKTGFNYQYQTNTKSGFEFLLPEYVSHRTGMFGLYKRRMPDKSDWTSSFRMDYGQNNTTSFTQYIWNSNEVILDSLVSKQTDDIFIGLSATTGWEKTWNKTSLATHISKSFRIPHPVETSSNGIHHGTFRHEQGQSDLQPESGYQWDLSLNYSGVKWNIEAGTYFNFIHNFIYLGPTFPAQFSNLPEAGQIFRYRQDNAVFTGFEVEWNYFFNSHWHLTQNMDYVQSINTVTGLALPFTPQPSAKTSVDYSVFPGKEDKDLKISVNHRYYMAAESGWRRDRSERITPATHLWGLTLLYKTQLIGKTTSINLSADNVLNTPFLNHMSRYRWLNIPDQGRNVSVVVRMTF